MPSYGNALIALSFFFFLVLFLLPLPSIFAIPGILRRLLFLLLASLPVLPLRPANLRFPVYQAVLAFRSAAFVEWARWTGPLWGRDWNFAQMEDLLDLWGVVLAIVAMFAVAFSLEYEVNWRCLQEVLNLSLAWRPLEGSDPPKTENPGREPLGAPEDLAYEAISSRILALLGGTPYLVLFLLASCDFLLWRRYRTQEVVPVSSDAAMLSLLWCLAYAFALFGWFYNGRRLLWLLRTPVPLVLWLVLVALWLLPLPTLLRLSGPRQFAFLLLALIPVFPLKPWYLKLSCYRTALIWRSATLPPWTLSLGLLLVGAFPDPAEKILLWFSVVATVAAFLGMDFLVRWRALQQRMEKALAQRGPESPGVLP